MYFTSSSSPPFSQLTFEISKLKKIHSRRLLLHTPFYHPYASAPPPSGGASSPESNVGNSPFNANAFMVLAILLCALICTFGLHTIIRFALRTCARAGLLSGGRHSAVRMANTGIKKAALKTFSTVNYSAAVMAKVPGLASECVICLSEFAQGEKLKLLPKCNHGFHIRCIDKWLRSHSSCPTCRHCLLDTCKKIVGCSDNQPQAPTPTPTPMPTPTPTPALAPAPAPAPATLLPPLEHESVVISYRASC